MNFFKQLLPRQNLKNKMEKNYKIKCLRFMHLFAAAVQRIKHIVESLRNRTSKIWNVSSSKKLKIITI